MTDQLKKLLEVKSIITIIVIIGLVIFTQQGKIDGEKFFQIVTIIVTFYFGTQNGKSEAKNQAASTTLTVETKPLQITTGQQVTEHPEMKESAAAVGE